MTYRLYYDDAYISRFTSRVRSCAAVDGGWEVVLESTAFFPEGGGQPGDTGVLGAARVLDTRERGDEVVHLCSEPLEEGAEVEGRLDWERRFDLMQQHSGEHILSGIVHRRFGWDNVGFHMGAEIITVDFSGPLSEDDIRSAELEANAAIWRNLPFETFFPEPEELEKLAYRSKKAIEGRVRIVRAGDEDLCACCGTHVSHAGEIGVIKILTRQSFRSGTRIEMVSGRRAYMHLNALSGECSAISAMLSVPPERCAEAVTRLSGELEAERYRAVGLENRLFAEIAAAHAGEGDVVLFEPDLNPDALRRLSDCVASSCGGLCAAFSGAGGEWKYALTQKSADISALTREMNSALSGRGGGRGGLSQGALKAEKGEIENFFAKRRTI